MTFRANGLTGSQAFWFWFSDLLGQAAAVKVKVRSRMGWSRAYAGDAGVCGVSETQAGRRRAADRAVDRGRHARGVH